MNTIADDGYYNPEALPEFWEGAKEWAAPEDPRKYIRGLMRYRSAWRCPGRGNKSARRYHGIRHAQYLGL